MRVPMNEGEWAKSSGKEIRASAGMALRVTVSIKVASGKRKDAATQTCQSWAYEVVERKPG